MIPILELKTQFQNIQVELEAAVLRALRSTSYIMGPEVKAFESEFAAWNGAKFGIGVGNGTDALQLALRAFDIGPGDEVICPAFTFVATAGAAALAGAAPVFVDIDQESFSLNTVAVEEAITSKTKAIVAVHLYGHPAPVDKLKEIADKHHLALIEDCAQATGALLNGQHVGTFGDIGCFSFFPSKNLGGIGDGGMCITSSPALQEKLNMLRGHGSKQRYYHEILGTNSRLDEIQAAALRVKLGHVEAWNNRRREIAALYTKQLSGSGVITPSERPGCKHVFHQYTILVSKRDELKKYLEEQGFGSMIYYPISLHQQKTFCTEGITPPTLPVTESIQPRVLSLPMFPELTDEQVCAIAAAVRNFAKNNQ